MNVYSAYNLTFRSELPLLEMLPSAETLPDVEIRFGRNPDSLPDSATKRLYWEAMPDTCLFRVPNVATYLIRDGREITIERFPDSSDKDVRTFLFGTPIAALLTQRRILTLHASAIQTKYGAVLFAGQSGSGKSTLMNAFQQRGYAILSDDVTAIVMDRAGRPLALPALRQSRLWPDSLSILEINADNLQTVRKGLTKRRLPISNFCNEALPIFAVYRLGEHNQSEIEVACVKENDQLPMLVGQTYRKRIVYGLGNQIPHFESMMALCKNAKLFKLTRPAIPFLLDQMVEQVEKSWL